MAHVSTAVPIKLEGLWVPIVTPFATTGAVDDDSLRRLARRILGDGATGVVALGTTGEPATLSLQERLRVVEICGQASQDAGRQFMAGVGTNHTAGTIEEIEAVMTVTCPPAAVLVVVPYYTRPSEQAVIEHFALVADASPVPVVIYNIPYRTGRGLGSDALVAASGHPNVVGLKQSVGALDADTLQVLASSSDDFQVLAGDDALIAPTALMGGSGAIAAAAHMCTPMFVDMTASALAGDASRARELAAQLQPLVRAGFAEPSPAVWKGALHRMGAIATPDLRRPMTTASDRAVDQLVAAADATRDT